MPAILTMLQLETRRLDAFRRNRFGFTNSAMIIFIPHMANGRKNSHYFITNIRLSSGSWYHPGLSSSWPRGAAGIDTTAYPGSTLTVPVDPGIAVQRVSATKSANRFYGVHTWHDFVGVIA